MFQSSRMSDKYTICLIISKENSFKTLMAAVQTSCDVRALRYDFQTQPPLLPINRSFFLSYKFFDYNLQL